MYDKSTRVLWIFQQLLEGKKVKKVDSQELFGGDNRTFERDIATLRMYLGQRVNDCEEVFLEYDH